MVNVPLVVIGPPVTLIPVPLAMATEVTPALSPVFVPDKFEPDTVPDTVRFANPLATGLSVIASYIVEPLGVNLQRHQSLLLSSVRLKSKYVPLALIVVVIDAESEPSAANPKDVIPVNVVWL